MTTTILLDALQYIGYILIFPGFLFCFVIGMLLCGIDRKLVARMQERVGPPILQPFYDFFFHIIWNDIQTNNIVVKINSLFKLCVQKIYIRFTSTII